MQLNINQLKHPKSNPVFETDSDLNITIERFKDALPITDENEMVRLLNIYQNTLIKLLNT